MLNYFDSSERYQMKRLIWFTGHEIFQFPTWIVFLLFYQTYLIKTFMFANVLCVSKQFILKHQIFQVWLSEFNIEPNPLSFVQ